MRLLLRLVKNSGNEVSAVLVGECVKCFPILINLESFFLDDNEFGTEGSSLIAAGLNKEGVMPRLRVLSVCCCEITGKGGLLLAK
jgi:hypothetical protein